MPPISAFPTIDRVFRRHGLSPVLSVQPLAGGRLNQAARVSGDYVLRWRDAARATGSLKREVVVLERLKGRVRAPEVLASGVDDILGEYVIQRWLPGHNLLRAWLENPDVATREWWIREWIESIRAIHTERFPKPVELIGERPREFSSWRGYIETRIRKRLDSLMRTPSIDRGLILAAERYLRRQAPVLEDGPFCLIHRDLHFAYVLVEGPHLSASLDFELAEVGTPDYELDTIYRFLTFPSLYAEPDQAAAASPARFASVWVRLRRGYPELFTVRHLRERLSLYALDHDLSALAQAYSGRWSGESAVTTVLERIRTILEHRYGPE